ncbi:unnamed protein product [Closterium sp. Naga37s-1]|nr:unnamed protein product [Closterium sp. Naga37s-1]
MAGPQNQSRVRDKREKTACDGERAFRKRIALAAREAREIEERADQELRVWAANRESDEGTGSGSDWVQEMEGDREQRRGLSAVEMEDGEEGEERKRSEESKRVGLMGALSGRLGSGLMGRRGSGMVVDVGRPNDEAEEDEEEGDGERSEHSDDHSEQRENEEWGDDALTPLGSWGAEGELTPVWRGEGEITPQGSGDWGEEAEREREREREEEGEGVWTPVLTPQGSWRGDMSGSERGKGRKGKGLEGWDGLVGEREGRYEDERGSEEGSERRSEEGSERGSEGSRGEEEERERQWESLRDGEEEGSVRDEDEEMERGESEGEREGESAEEERERQWAEMHAGSEEGSEDGS